jgi:hypothetical protein
MQICFAFFISGQESIRYARQRGFASRDFNADRRLGSVRGRFRDQCMLTPRSMRAKRARLQEPMTLSKKQFETRDSTSVSSRSGVIQLWTHVPAPLLR